MSVVVFASSTHGKVAKSALEAIYYGSLIAGKTGTTVTTVTFGSVAADDLKALGNYGATKVLHASGIEDMDSQRLTRLVAQAVNDEGAEVIIFSHDPTGKAIAPRVSALLDAGLVTGVVEMPQMDGKFTVRKNVFSGKATALYQIHTDKKILSLLPNSIPVQISTNSAEVIDFNPDTGAAGCTVRELRASSGTLNLPEAELVVSAGRGLKGPENWGMIEELARVLGAATACSRPVADIGWRPHHEHVGQTGIAIRPNLYFAIGISGAIQHLAGVNGSKVIVVINTDADAPFFKAADYGIIGDAFEVVPKLTEAIKKFKAEN